ncbi:rcc01693 family protein [Phaeovulum sp. NW3]|uniref:rcc01693 family protein n=1 Tax=Phaeovulum sp. NW3 TaxID=2934933 RepID=UPI002021E032|nr:rcc01693 family protein [Phaeovulum sp. NW3]MCL7464799.1 phage tail assembly chaperone [Phaeovulum sp. NW3]
MSGLDWPGLMRVGIRGLGLEPAAFWRLTPAELALMLGEAAGAPPLTRARLEELAARWPDAVGPDGGKGTGDDRGGWAGRSGPAGGGA